MKEKKIGIITWHYFPNYGSALQSYALYTTIQEKLHANCEIINYRNAMYYPKGIGAKLKCNKYAYYVGCKLHNKQREYKFYQFVNKNFVMTKAYPNIQGLRKVEKKYNKIITGSDQVWSPNVLDETYLLNFVADSRKKVSYAPSIVIEQMTEQQKSIYKSHLKQFSSLSVREEKGREIIEKITGLIPEVVLDPTLLLEEQDYEKILQEQAMKEPYILCYFLGNAMGYESYIQTMRRSTGCKVVAILTSKEEIPYGDWNVYDAGPSEFLGYIKGAQFVLTDSFHGLAFSVIYRKQFLVFERFQKGDTNGQNDRIYNVLEKLSLRNRVIIEDTQLVDVPQIGYEQVEKLLSIEQQKSMHYLAKALEIEGEYSRASIDFSENYDYT